MRLSNQNGVFWEALDLKEDIFVPNHFLADWGYYPETLLHLPHYPCRYPRYEHTRRHVFCDYGAGGGYGGVAKRDTGQDSDSRS